MSFSEEAQSDVPLLSQKHSGIPDFLLEKARETKASIFETRTKVQSSRQRLPVIPHGVEEQVFLDALTELGGQLGAANVERNDKPLKDGWYVPSYMVNSGFPPTRGYPILLIIVL